MKPCKVSFRFMKVLKYIWTCIGLTIQIGVWLIQHVAWGSVMVTPLHPQQARFNFVSCDEVNTIDNRSWIFISIYMMHNCKRFILLNLERLTKGVGDYNLTMIKNNLVSFGVLAYNLMLQESLFVCFGVNNVMIFQGDKTTITKLLQGKHAPFLTI